MLTRYTKLVPANSPLAMGMAVGCVAVATAVRLALTAVIGPTAPFITMFPAVLLAAVIGGLWPGLLAIVLSIVATWFFLFTPRMDFGPLSAADVTSVVFFMLGALLVVLVATSMRRAVERLGEAQEKLLAALDASSTGTWRWDIQRDIIEWDPAMANVFGLGLKKTPRNVEEFASLIHPEDRDYARTVIGDAIKNGKTIEYEFRAVLPEGEERWIYDRSRPVYDPEGKPLYMIGACLDITSRKKTEERQSLLIHELNHRVKNTLATVQSLAIQTMRSSPSPEAFQSNFMARLMALSATHDLLTQTYWESASLSEVIEAELRPHGGIDGLRIKARGDAVRLKPQQALSLGLAFHELATNATKYGALSSSQGQLSITWDLEADAAGKRQLLVHWHEQDGPPVAKPRRQGFGTRLIDRSIVHELGGAIEMDYASTGLECRMRVPLTSP
ncbi:sensor histidine kinase [Microvirga sp. KLBC 81]|uniref:sensor histidine kinase n=1 Tax=Microvirga sp. KLBC 81 TaxID=1862707 RepID=UPI001402BDD6|nr:HWE histidine kinase domain-containing protein [Microvirga sp. KLBC 81]